MSDASDVLFVVIDSARLDRVSGYGHDRETTPALDDLADGATRYDNAFVPAPWTLPSHCSMFTGKTPSEHGITNGFADRNLELSTDHPTLAQRLTDRGYATAGFSNNPWVGQLSGLDRGFDRFVEWDLEISRSPADADTRRRDALYSKLHGLLGKAAGQPQALLKRRFFTSNLVDRAEDWLRETVARPGFTFLNLMEAHSPYYPPASAFRELGLETPGAIESRTLNAKLLAYVMGKRDLDPDTRRRVMEYYDASLRYQDGKLADLFEVLRESGRFDDALVVVCADHGKTLGDFDRDGTPPHYVRDVNVNVPLVVKWPGQTRGERVSEPVELLDLFDVLESPGEVDALPRRTDGALVEDHLPHTGSTATDVVRWRVLADESTKYVRSEDGREFLFDRSDTETERDATTADLRPYRERLDERISSLSRPSGRTSDEAADDEVRAGVADQLQDLGYLG